MAHQLYLKIFDFINFTKEIQFSVTGDSHFTLSSLIKVFENKNNMKILVISEDKDKHTP